ncbi:hypothetical protein GW813_06835 [bacterium]|nr:hypothetical protein [bacterium]PIV80580.1 MAG: hypothetical protein COW53_08925 [bacterium CG17_big_fil_post_rev_8_21_14_2_50_64_8]PJA75305.1 MAG: hypothetical protein CO151_06755 [bacterium CG_4_9_14_3_um_filter_65_15]
MTFCALQEVASGGVSWWQTIGGLLVVFSLLLLSLRLLGRFNKRRAVGDAALLKVWQLGPKREIQVLRLFDTVHYIYCHDGGMVQLQQQSLAAFEESGTLAVEHGEGDKKRFLGAASG